MGEQCIPGSSLTCTPSVMIPQINTRPSQQQQHGDDEDDELKNDEIRDHRGRLRQSSQTKSSWWNPLEGVLDTFIGVPEETKEEVEQRKQEKEQQLQQQAAQMEVDLKEQMELDLKEQMELQEEEEQMELERLGSQLERKKKYDQEETSWWDAFEGVLDAISEELETKEELQARMERVRRQQRIRQLKLKLEENRQKSLELSRRQRSLVVPANASREKGEKKTKKFSMMPNGFSLNQPPQCLGCKVPKEPQTEMRNFAELSVIQNNYQQQPLKQSRQRSQEQPAMIYEKDLNKTTTSPTSRQAPMVRPTNGFPLRHPQCLGSKIPNEPQTEMKNFAELSEPRNHQRTRRK
ncbi:unnamed protein product [Cylindrotheca closterium]|uniref:Uncharacterized protein n=1 Tax=Cylindrotheca closterium TaxID=2856 RepID=A0AAD2FMV5_9STRA|nr:unnamed protein product [Cylindrotheca closterium]